MGLVSFCILFASLALYIGIGVFCYMQMAGTDQPEKIKIGIAALWPITFIVLWVSMAAGIIRKD